MINVTRSSMPSYKEYCNEIRSLWDSRWLTNMGEKHNKLKKELESYLGVEHIDLTTNGHMALELTLLAFGLKGEVITTPFTFASTTHAIVRAGLKPVFCDIDPESFTIDVKKIESLITNDTCAIMPVHVYGNICNIEEIEKIASNYGLKVIYDAAHTFGVRYKGKGIATYGDVSCFSFHATKVFHTIEGGAICFRDEDFGRRFFEIKDFGIHDEETISYIGPNAKFNEFCAAMGLCNLRHIEEEIIKRKYVVEKYRSNLNNIKGLQINKIQLDVEPNYAYFPVVFDKIAFGSDRDEVKSKLNENGINARKYFYPLTNDFDCYKSIYKSSKTPIALDISKKVLTLPLYADLTLEDVDRICEVILSCKK